MKKTYAIFFVLLSALLNAQIPTNGLIGRWEFSGNANDLSGSGNHGTVYGATLVPDRCGNPNSAYQFNGTSDYIQMLSAGPTGNSSRTVSFWALTSYTAFGSLWQATQVFYYGGGSSPMGTCFQINYNYNCQGLGLDVCNVEIIRGNGCISDNNWHHIALVYNSAGTQDINSVEFYVDGNLLPSSITCFMTGTTQVLNTGSAIPITIGGLPSSQPRWFPGTLDDYYLYNRALSQAEVQQLFHACPQPVFGNSLVCSGSVNTYSVPPVLGTQTYYWNLPSGWSGTSFTNTISAVSGINPGVVSVSYTTSCGAPMTRSLAVTYSNVINPVISVSSGTVCTGQAVTLSSVGNYSCTWQPGNISGASITVTPTSSTVYTLNVSGPSVCASGTATGMASASVLVLHCIGLETVSETNPPLIYPNPNNGSFVIETTGGMVINCSVVNMLGQEIYSTMLVPNEKNEISLSQVKGCYVLKLFTKDKSVLLQKKLIVD